MQSSPSDATAGFFGEAGQIEQHAQFAPANLDVDSVAAGDSAEADDSDDSGPITMDNLDQFDPSAALAEANRGKVAAACTLCAKLKVKCDGHIPCARCVRSQRAHRCVLRQAKQPRKKRRLSTQPRKPRRKQQSEQQIDEVPTATAAGNARAAPSSAKRASRVTAGAPAGAALASKQPTRRTEPAATKAALDSKSSAELYKALILPAPRAPIGPGLRGFLGDFESAAYSRSLANCSSLSVFESEEMYRSVLSSAFVHQLAVTPMSYGRLSVLDVPLPTLCVHSCQRDHSLRALLQAGVHSLGALADAAGGLRVDDARFRAVPGAALVLQGGGAAAWRRS